MKAKKILLTAALALFSIMAIECQPEALHIKYSADVTIRTSELLSGFTAFKPSDAEMFSINNKPSRLLIRAFIYNSSGILTDSFSEYADDYGATYKFTATFEDANSTIVVFSYCVIGNLPSPDYQAYVITDEGRLSSLKVTTDNRISDIKWTTLGGYIGQVNSAQNSLDIQLAPLGGLVYVLFRSIHAHDSDYLAPDSYTFWHHSNNQVYVSGGSFSYGTTLSTTYSFVDDVEPSEHPSSGGIYIIKTLMPGTYDAYATWDVGSTSTSFGDRNITVNSGKQYVVEIDCADYNLSFREGTIQ